MSDIFFVKTSSLGDVIHHMPAVTTRGGITRMRGSPGWSRRPLRRWSAASGGRRGHSGGVAALAQGAAGRDRPGARSARSCEVCAQSRYDAIIDTQGLIRSALIARAARACATAMTRQHARARSVAALRRAPPRRARACTPIARNRALTGQALGYSPEGRPGLRARSCPADARRDRYAVLLHGTARPEKEWPEENWRRLIAALQGAGLEVTCRGALSASASAATAWLPRRRRGSQSRTAAARRRGAADRRAHARGRRRHRPAASRGGAWACRWSRSSSAASRG